MTEPLTFTDLSPELVAEFSPPCEACARSTDWVALVDCPTCGRCHHFYCDGCKTEIAIWPRVVHYPCGSTPCVVAGWDRL